jgi:hypothetical protein
VAYEEYSGGWTQIANSAGSFDSIQSRESNIQQNQIGLEFFGSLYGFQPI